MCMHRFRTSLVLIIWTSVGAARLAAQNNGGPPGPQPIDITLQAGESPNPCTFGIRIQGNGKTKTITLPGNRDIITSPGLHVTVTNLADPSKQVTLNITGAFHQTTEPDGSVVTIATGRNLLFDPVQGFVLAIGHFSYIFDAEGKLTQPLKGKGQLIDVCALLE